MTLYSENNIVWIQRAQWNTKSHLETVFHSLDCDNLGWQSCCPRSQMRMCWSDYTIASTVLCWTIGISIHYLPDRINESPILKVAIYKFAKLVHVAPTTHVVLLYTFNPIKHSCYPLQLLELCTTANYFRVFTKVYWGIGNFFASFGSLNSKVVIKLAKIAALE